jgi:hypothetical protein
MTKKESLSKITFQKPPSWGLPSPPSFSFSLKVRIRIMTFDLNLGKIHSYNFPWENNND